MTKACFAPGRKFAFTPVFTPEREHGQLERNELLDSARRLDTPRSMHPRLPGGGWLLWLAPFAWFCCQSGGMMALIVTSSNDPELAESVRAGAAKNLALRSQNRPG